mmetsp:Transcript_5099/g.15716  ORF Transcript_5099/g.15716 Transcript_5099/m.15716 type:complete len:296 (-) Transcript_5099:271-1158(-)
MLAGGRVGARRVDDLAAGHGAPVLPLALQAVVVADAVAVVSHELVGRHSLLGEFGSEEGRRLLTAEADCLQEESELLPRRVLEVFRLEQLGVHVVHAEREGAAADGRQVGQAHRRAGARARVVVAHVLRRESLEEGGEPVRLLLAQRRPLMRRRGEPARPLRAHGGRDDRDEVGRGDEGGAAAQIDAPLPHQVDHLLERHLVVLGPLRRRVEIAARRERLVQLLLDLLVLIARDGLVLETLGAQPGGAVLGRVVDKPPLEELQLVLQEPPAQVLRAAVCQPQDEVRVVVLDQARG